MECDSENGSGRAIDLEASGKTKTKNKIHPFFQSSGIILYAPLESPTVYLSVQGQWVSEAGTL